MYYKTSLYIATRTKNKDLASHIIKFCYHGILFSFQLLVSVAKCFSNVWLAAAVKAMRYLYIRTSETSG